MPTHSEFEPRKKYHWLIITPLKYELREYLKHFKNVTKVKSAINKHNPLLYQTALKNEKSILLGSIGIGKQSTNRVNRILMNFAFENIIVAGCCGALKPGLHKGDHFIITRQLDSATGREYCFSENRPLFNSISKTTAVTSESALYTSKEKIEFGCKYNGSVIEMENSPIIDIFKQRGISFTSIYLIRTILDTVHDDLSYLKKIPTDEGNGFLKSNEFHSSNPGSVTRISKLRSQLKSVMSLQAKIVLNILSD